MQRLMIKATVISVFFISVALAASHPASAQIYIWIDKEGFKHITNTAPPPEAKIFRELDEITPKAKPEKIVLPVFHAERCAELFGEKVGIFGQKIVITKERTAALIEKLTQMPNPSRNILDKILSIDQIMAALDAKERVISAQINQNQCE
ncbi:MAG TPA: DUF4124 domain-containing protein [bacterium]|nr:DUF4124 domain-containing protein [bacterium]